jgi:hypothetical protein
MIREEVVIRRLTWLALRSRLGEPTTLDRDCEVFIIKEPRVHIRACVDGEWVRLVITYEPLEVVAWARRTGLLWRLLAQSFGDFQPV